MSSSIDIAALEVVLVRGAAELQLELDETARLRLLTYLQLLHRWNATYNLTAVRDPAQMLSHHLLDCLAVVPALDAQLDQKSVQVLDVGSGGGLPGVVLAIVRPRLVVTCVDTVGKKSAFIRQVAVELGLPNLHAVHQRVETMTTQYDLVVSRAFASLAQFCSLTHDRLRPGGVWLALKGRRPEDEVAALPDDVEVFHVEQLHVPGLEAERCLVWIRPCPQG